MIIIKVEIQDDSMGVQVSECRSFEPVIKTNSPGTVKAVVDDVMGKAVELMGSAQRKAS